MSNPEIHNCLTLKFVHHGSFLHMLFHYIFLPLRISFISPVICLPPSFPHRIFPAPALSIRIRNSSACIIRISPTALSTACSRLSFHFPKGCTVRLKLAAASKVMELSGDQIHCLSASRIKMSGIGLIVRIDGYKHSFSLCLSLKDTLPVGQNHRTEISVV